MDVVRIQHPYTAAECRLISPSVAGDSTQILEMSKKLLNGTRARLGLPL